MSQAMINIWQYPMTLLCFFSLMMSFLSLWIKRTPWLWGTFLVISYLLAYHERIVDAKTLLPLFFLCIIHKILAYNVQGLLRVFLFLAAVAISFGLCLHFYPWFHNWRILHHIQVSHNGVPYTLYANYDKPFIGIFILAWSLPLLQTKHEWYLLLKKTLPFTLIAIIFLLGPAFYAKVIQWDPKFPTFGISWIAINLFLVVIPEEAFFRGFIQKEIFKWLGGKGAAHIGSVVVASLIFTLPHFIWVNQLPFLGMVFLAGLVYGSIYQWTKAIESSIVCHFITNLVHFLFFTYPALIH